MNKEEILDAIHNECSRLETLKAIYSYYKKQGDISYRIEQCQDSIEISVDKILDFNKKLNELEKEEA